jgi:diguanylate cyclase (GGDEF)-like protein
LIFGDYARFGTGQFEMSMRTTFRTKLLLLTIVPLAVAQVVTLFAVMRTVEDDVQARAQESLTIGAVVVNEFLSARAEQLQTSVAVLAADYGLKEATATGDAATIRSVLENHSRRVGADIAALVDLDGALIASTLDDSVRNRVDVVQFIADASQQQNESTALVSGSAYHLFTVPLRAPVTIGWVVVGFEIDEQLMKRISDLTGLDVSLLHSDTGFKTVLISQSAAPEDIDLRQSIDTVYMASSDADQSLTIQTPFIRGDATVLVVLQRSVREAMLPYVEARRGLLAFGAALLAFVAIAGGWFSTTIASPLRTLGAAARRMISGDYATNVAVQSDDEFGELASSFNAMQTAISEREQRISHHALHDSLTDLPNRAKVLTELTRIIEQARKDDTRISVLSIGLVRMSEISSTLGHNATDELIKMAARHLQASLNDVEVLGHTGTNEFVLVLPGHDIEDALSYVDRIEKLLGSGVTLGRVDIMLQTEVGIAVFPRHGSAANDLLRFASIARVEAETSNEQVRVYQSGREDEFLRRLRIVNDLPSALRRGEIDTWFQPKISLPDGHLCGAEALVRWQHPELGFLSPDDFIPAAEQSGTIVLLTRHVISEALRKCRVWEDAGHVLQISVNLSARDLLDENLPYHVMQILKENQLPAVRLTLEVTESSIMEDLRRSIAVLELLQDIGVNISMDDFGTGHSSLAQLRNIPLHELKIDKSFIMTLCEDAHNDAIVRTTIELAHGMGLKVVAEGVEDEATMRRVAVLGCEQAQGYVLSKPLANTDMLVWLQSFEARAYGDRRSQQRAFSDPQAAKQGRA